jgi:hypothetical protein
VTRKLCRRRRVDDPALVMAGLGPRVGEQHENSLEAAIGQGPEQQSGVIDHDA